jgi:hypothetical protein
MAKPKPQPTKPVEKPKAPRGSKSATQVGNDNQRELYNAYRGMKEGGVYGKGAKYPGFTINKPLLAKDKISKAEATPKKSKPGSMQKPGGNEALAARNMQRAGGKTVTRKVQPAKPNRKSGTKASRGR